MLCPFLETLSFSNFAWFLRWMSVELYRIGLPWCFWGSPLIRVNKRYSISGNRHIWRTFPTQSMFIHRKYQAKFENESVSRNRHTYNQIAQSNSMILVSFSSAEDALFNDVKKYTIFRSQGTENLPLRFFLDTRYTASIQRGIKASNFMGKYTRIKRRHKFGLMINVGMYVQHRRSASGV